MKQLVIGKKYAFKTKWWLFLYCKVNTYLVNRTVFNFYFSVEIDNDCHLISYEDNKVYDSLEECESNMIKFVDDNFNTVDKKYWKEMEEEKKEKRGKYLFREENDEE